MTKIVWNGCDSYIEADQAIAHGYNFDGEKLYTQRGSFAAFDATEIDPNSLPIDEDGERDFSGIFGTEAGRYYK